MVGADRDLLTDSYFSYFYFIGVVQDSPRTGLGIPVTTKNHVCRTTLQIAEPPFGFEFHERLVPVSCRERLFRHPFARNPAPHPRFYSANRDTTAPATRAYKFLSSTARGRFILLYFRVGIAMMSFRSLLCSHLFTTLSQQIHPDAPIE